MMKEPQTQEEVKEYHKFLHDIIHIFEMIALEEEQYWNEPAIHEKDVECWGMLREFMNAWIRSPQWIKELPEKDKKLLLNHFALLIAATPIREEQIMDLLGTLPWETFHMQLLELYKAKMEGA